MGKRGRVSGGVRRGIRGKSCKANPYGIFFSRFRGWVSVSDKFEVVKGEWKAPRD